MQLRKSAPPPSSFSSVRLVSVSTSAQLKTALITARPGDRIQVSDGIYTGQFVASASRTRDMPIGVCGSRNVILTSGSNNSGYGFYLNGANHWHIVGLTIRTSQKGVMLDHSNDCLLSGLLIHDIGMEAVHFRKFSSDNRIELSEIRQTGRMAAGQGEGVTVGSAQSNMEGDRSNYNQVVANRIGPDVTAESIDIKEYTKGGIIADNYFDGRGMSGVNYADSWIDVKGNGYYFLRNHVLDGIQTHEVVNGWGSFNVFDENNFEINATGFGIATHSTTINIVRCNNKVIGAKSGLTNLPNCSDEPQTLGRPGGEVKANWPDWQLKGSTIQVVVAPDSTNGTISTMDQLNNHTVPTSLTSGTSPPLPLNCRPLAFFLRCTWSLCSLQLQRVGSMVYRPHSPANRHASSHYNFVWYGSERCK